MFRPQSKKNLRPLKAIIKGCAEESALLTKNARKLVKEKKQAVHQEKIRLGIYTRHYNLVYGFLRGMDYKQIEKNSKSKAIDYFGKIPWGVEYISIGALHDLILIYQYNSVGKFITKENLKEWIVDGKRFFLTKDENKRSVKQL
jgi:hypothetical protein